MTTTPLLMERIARIADTPYTTFPPYLTYKKPHVEPETITLPFDPAEYLPYEPRVRGAAYMDRFFLPELFHRLIKDAAEYLREYDYDAIAVQGVSGIVAGSALAYETGKYLIVVRKDGTTSSHTNTTVEGLANPRRYIIVDDFVATGETVRRIMREVTRKNTNAKCLGTLELTELERMRRDGLTQTGINTDESAG